MDELNLAITENNLERIQELLTDDIDLNTRDQKGYHPLDYALKNDIDVDTLNLLVSHGAYKMLYDNILRCEIQTIKIILDNVPFSKETLYWLLWTAIDDFCNDRIVPNIPIDKMEWIKLIVQYTNINFKVENEHSHLMHAASCYDIELVKELLEHNADPIISESVRNMGYLEMIDLIDSYATDEIKEPVSDP